MPSATRATGLAARSAGALDGMLRIPGGAFRMGSSSGYPEERPMRRVEVSPFWMDRAPVTNADFARFVEETGHVTVAERAPDPASYPGVGAGSLVPGSLVFTPPPVRVPLDDPRAWWAYVPGASWRRPRGPRSSIAGRDDHPVVHVAFDDALAFARWSGKDLPTEAEWERAARGGLDGATYAWGDELEPEGRRMANTWLGEFPWLDGRPAAERGTSRVGAFPANGYGLVDMIGNVWEWTRDDYVEPGARRTRSACCSGDATLEARKVVKGGSYLCAADHCARYRPAARQPQSVDTSSCHIGFRCVVRAREAGG